MTNKTVAKVFTISCACAVFLCLLAWSVTQVIDQRNAVEFALGMRLLFARIVEEGPPRQAMDRLIQYRTENPIFTSAVWMVTNKDEVLASNTGEPLPEKWKSLTKPVKAHGFVADGALSAIKINSAEPRFLVFLNKNPSIFLKDSWLKIAWAFIAFTIAGAAALSLVLFYLRRKSYEAKKILGRLEKGDLKARFQIQGFDEIGNLMLHFNRMADEIERLVLQVREVEKSRRLLVQELGHDLRTPLMSLQASFDALVDDWQVMKLLHREQILTNCRAEIGYFSELVDGLLFIAQMDEPRYRTPTEKINLHGLLNEQLRLYEERKRPDGIQLKWTIHSIVPHTHAEFLGDSQLLSRMIRNLFENASRFANETVTVKIDRRKDRVWMEVQDDGPGMTKEEMDQYGKVRGRRTTYQRKGARLSLGLGSVIIQRIVELHKGNLQIRNVVDLPSSSIRGMVVAIQFPI